VAIIVDERTKVCVQGITGHQGSFHTRQMLDYGTRVVAGIAPARGGREVEGVSVYESVEEAVDKRGASASVIMVPAAAAKDAAFEAIGAGISVLVIITEHIPVHDTMDILTFAAGRQATVIGPNTFGIISPGKCKLGIMPSGIYAPGPVGVIARSGTLGYEIANSLTAAGMGQSTVVGLGGDRVVGVDFVDCLRLMERDPDTKAVVMVGEIGGQAEEEAAEFIKGMTKPVVAYIAGKSAPAGKRMGHAGAIIERGRGTFAGKVEALRRGGVAVADLPSEVPALAKAALSKQTGVSTSTTTTGG
jgi:succinyl-CoA synthetase alpha subunit